MENILVVGIHTVVGANLAASLSDESPVVGLTSADSTSIAACQTAYSGSDDIETVRNWMASVRPSRVIYCGPAAQSSWQTDAVAELNSRAVVAARNWAQAAVEFDCRLTVVSSDAAFTGPWMFHDEESACTCPSGPARTIREIEREVVGLCSEALIVRTNAYGWSPAGGGPGWIEAILAELEEDAAQAFDSIRHATPILAADLAKILNRAHDEQLQGVYHIAGAERVNPAQFVQRLADQFGLSYLRPLVVRTLSERPTGFGSGETSLATKKIRRALGVPMPMVAEGLSRLYEQLHDGHRDRLNAAPAQIHERVA
jgi:dTDP-4-dehydrorhamnose reductase